VFIVILLSGRKSIPVLDWWRNQRRASSAFGNEVQSHVHCLNVNSVADAAVLLVNHTLKSLHPPPPPIISLLNHEAAVLLCAL